MNHGMSRGIAFLACLLVAGAMLIPAIDTAAEENAPFSLPALPYAFDALEPVIDRATMEIHHGRHHRAYINNLNAAVAEHAALQGLTLEEILADVSRFGDHVRNNAGGHYNHALFWRLMAPVETGGDPSTALLAQIERDFGSLADMQRAFEQAGVSRFGSGWAWLVWNGEALVVGSTPNQDNPLMDVSELAGAPILANDVWEHAYYLHYQNRRGDYLSSWWRIVDWHEVNRLFAEAVSKPQAVIEPAGR